MRIVQILPMFSLVLDDSISYFERSLRVAEYTPKSLIDVKVHLPSLTIHLVEYSQPVEHLIPPMSVVMSIVDGQLDAEAFRQRVLRAAEGLAMA